jgi:hypothetical protein
MLDRCVLKRSRLASGFCERYKRTKQLVAERCMVHHHICIDIGGTFADCLVSNHLPYPMPGPKVRTDRLSAHISVDAAAAQLRDPFATTADRGRPVNGSHLSLQTVSRHSNAAVRIFPSQRDQPKRSCSLPSGSRSASALIISGRGRGLSKR